MGILQIKSASQQVADYLREEIKRGTWRGTMPGQSQLLTQLGVGKDTVSAALTLLEQEGLLVNKGERRRREIVIPDGVDTSALRIGLLCYDENDRASRILIELFHSLTEQGHTVFFADKTLQDLKMNVQPISRFVKKTGADAWVVSAGSKEILKWFLAEKIQAFALYGGKSSITIAGTGPNHNPALRIVLQRLNQLGHRRIVNLCRRGKHSDAYGHTERFFLEELQALGIVTGSYNLPRWEGSPDGFRECLDSLFKNTPPTALIIEEATYFFATLQFCTDYNLRVPQDVSLICNEFAASFDFANPSVAHISWDRRPLLRRILGWTANIAQGKEDKVQSHVKAKFVEGGTIGPAPGS